jgi:alkanesulfonate monooxygenase SsuD/methylene tetrahydromethanopterin reductase-like flavin-dependent oxidoreductase (luciferase family)
VQGPLNLPRSPQGRPVLVQAGGSADGRELAARHAEAVFAVVRGIAGLRRELKAAPRPWARPDAVKVLGGLTTIIGSTEAEALRRRDELVDLIPWRYSLNRLAGTLGISPGASSSTSACPRTCPCPAAATATTPSSTSCARWPPATATPCAS